MATPPSKSPPASTSPLPAPQTQAPDDDGALAVLGGRSGEPDPRRVVTPGAALNYLDPEKDEEAPPRAVRSASTVRRDAHPDAAPDREGRVDMELNDEDRERISTAVKNSVGMQPNRGWPRVICMKAGAPDRVVASLFSWAGAGVDRIDFHPFQRSAPLHPAIVAAVTRDVPHKRYGYYWKHFWETPPVNEVDAEGRERKDGHLGNCRGEMRFVDPISGQEIETCIYAKCRHHPLPAHLHHSIWQAMAFLAQLKTDSAIRNYIRMHDPRAQVGHFATLVIDQRQRKMLEQMGVGAQQNENIIF